MCFRGVNVVQFTFIGTVLLFGLTEINQVITLIKCNLTQRRLTFYDTVAIQIKFSHIRMKIFDYIAIWYTDIHCSRRLNPAMVLVIS